MCLIATLILFALMTGNAFAAVETHQLVGSQLGIVWALPFVGMLLSIALLPLLTPHFWEHNFGKVAIAWSAAFVLPCAFVFGAYAAAFETVHTIAIEYLPFLILLFALFVVAGGIRLVGDPVATPRTNTAMLAFGTMLASLIGTTGASMLLIRPVIHANRRRTHNIHVFIFFIFLISNIGGSLTPLGDPPLFLGFLKGVDFYGPSSECSCRWWLRLACCLRCSTRSIRMRGAMNRTRRKAMSAINCGSTVCTTAFI